MNAPMIVLEGLDAAGKTTVQNAAEEVLRSQYRDLVVTREPGGTPVGERLRELLLTPDIVMGDLTETLLMLASRSDHFEQVIKPHLVAGDPVLCSRFMLSTLAYQCAGRGISFGMVQSMHRMILEGFQPDLTIIIDVPPAVSRERLERHGELDRIEHDADLEFSARVRDFMLGWSKHEAPLRSLVVDGTLDPESVRDQVIAAVQSTIQQFHAEDTRAGRPT